MKPPREVHLYEDERGGCPFAKAWDALDHRVQAKLAARIQMLREADWQHLVTAQVVKHLKDGIFELRVRGSGRFGLRVFFFGAESHQGTHCVLTEMEQRSVLNVRGRFDTYIMRAKQMQADWERRYRGRRA